MSNPYREIIQNLDDLVESRFIEMFGHNQYEEKPLVELFKTSSGGTPLKGKKEYYDGGNIPWLTSGEVNNEHITEAKSMITELALQETSAKIPPLNSVLVSMYGSIGYAGILEFKAAINQAICAIHPNPDYTPEWMCHYIRSKKEELANQGVGAALTNISQEKIRKLMVPLVPLPHQEAFTAFVHQVDKSKFIAQQAAEKYDQLVKSRFIEMIKSEEYPLKTIGESCVTTRVGPFGSALHKTEMVPEGPVFVLGTDNAVDNEFKIYEERYISSEKYSELERYTVVPGDIIITMMGTIGRSAVIPENFKKAIISSHLSCLSVDKNVVLPEYLQKCMVLDHDVSKHLESNKKGSIMSGLNLKIIKAIPFSCPPISVQKQFLTFVEQVDKSKFITSGGSF